MYSSVGEFVRALEAAGELQRIKVPVSRDLEITEITDRQCKAAAPSSSAAARTFDPAHCDRGGKALLFENVEGCDFPVLINAYGSFVRTEMALGATFPEIAARLTSLTKPEPPASLGAAFRKLKEVLPLLRVPPKRVSSGPCQEVVKRTDRGEVDITRIPVLKCWPLDGDPEAVGYPVPAQEGGGRFLTFGGIHTIRGSRGAMMPVMQGGSLQAEIDWLYGLQHFGIKLGLDNIRSLLEQLDHPESSFHSTLIAGTNGKGSVGAMLEAMLEAVGIKTGLFTSPHLVRPNERIRIRGRDIDDERLRRRLAAMRERVTQAVERGAMESHPSFFEVITATALQSFKEEQVQAALLEVGLGGRLDATNGVDGQLAVIVSIDLDHTKTLGPTIEHIAVEKGGIIRSGQPVISGVVRQRALSVLQRICRERGAELVDANQQVRLMRDDGERFTLESRRQRYADLQSALAGRHQIHNARIAIACLERISQQIGIEVDPQAVRHGLATTRWAGRLQWVRNDVGPDLLFDGAHNPAGVRTLTRYLEMLDRPPPVALLGVMRGKLMEEMIEALAPRLDRIVVTQPGVRRAAEADEVAAVARRYIERVDVVPDPAAAFERARELAARERDLLVTGSLYLVGEILALLEPRSVPGPVSM